MQNFVNPAITTIITTCLNVGLQISGFTNLYVTCGLWLIALCLGVYYYWPYVIRAYKWIKNDQSKVHAKYMISLTILLLTIAISSICVAIKENQKLQQAKSHLTQLSSGDSQEIFKLKNEVDKLTLGINALQAIILASAGADAKKNEDIDKCDAGMRLGGKNQTYQYNGGSIIGCHVGVDVTGSHVKAIFNGVNIGGRHFNPN